MLNTYLAAEETAHNPIVPLWQELVLGTIAFAIVPACTAELEEG